MRKGRGRVLVFLLGLVFFATGYVSTSMAKEEVPVFIYKPLKEFVIGHYPIDVSEIQGRTRDDFNRMVQELDSLGPDALHRMVVIGSASFEAPDLYNYDLGWERAKKVRQALLKIFQDAIIDIATKGEKPDIRQVEVYYGVTYADIPAKYLRQAKGKLILCNSVVFKVTPETVVMTINLAQNDFKLEPGVVVRAHLMTKNHEFGHEGDVGAIGESDGDGRLVFQWRKSERNLVASASDGYYVERIWFTTSEGEWLVPFCSIFLEPDNKKNDAIQVLIYPDSVRSVMADQFLDRVTRSGTPSDVYREKKDEYYKK